MKSIFTIVLFVLTLSAAQAQAIKVHSHTHSWVGGVCCSGGSEYTLTIKIPQGEWQRFDSVHVCTSSGIRRFGKKQLTTTEAGDTLVVTVKYSYSYSRQGNDYDLKTDVKNQITCTGYLWLLKEYVRKELVITSESESMTAYP